MSGPIPVHVLTGFLGSGKTTLLRHVLTSPGFSDCAVLINEFGEIGLDHHLIADVRGDAVLMRSGCICCTIRGDLAESIRDLYARRDRGEIAFSRVILETTGLADPIPILATIMHEPQIRHHFRLGNVIATVDAVNGTAQLDAQPEALRQAAAADRIVITKADLADPAEIDLLEARLARLNPMARRSRSAASRFATGSTALGPMRANALPAADLLISQDAFAAESRATEIAGWAAAGGEREHHVHAEVAGRHDGIRAFTIAFGGDVDWNVFAVWFTLLLHAHGADVLRVKGLLRVTGAPGPVVVNAVQHLVHPPFHLQAWPQDWRDSRLVFIVRDLVQAEIERSFTAFHAKFAGTLLSA
jgi:G3E family GTPase